MNLNVGKLNKTKTKPTLLAAVSAVLLSVFTPAMVTGQAMENTASVVLHSVWNLSADWHEQLFPGYLLPWRSR